MKIKLTTTIVLLLLSVNTYAFVTIVESNSFKEASDIVNSKSKKYGAEQTLIVFDIDNTLLTSHVDLGGDIWYQWQSGKLEIKPSSTQKVSCLY